MKWQSETGGIFGRGFQSHFGLSHTCREITPCSCPPRTWVIYILCFCTKCVWLHYFKHQLPHRILFLSTTWRKLFPKTFRNHFGANVVTPCLFRSCSSMNDFCSLENSTHGAAAWQSPVQQHLLSSEHLLECQWQVSHQCFVSKETYNKTWHTLRYFLA